MKFKSNPSSLTNSRESSLGRQTSDQTNNDELPNSDNITHNIDNNYELPDSNDIQQTSQHPLGDTLLDTMTHKKSQAKREDIIRMSQKFLKYLEINDSEMESHQSQTLQMMDEKIYQNHLKDHTSLQEVIEPQNFSPTDRLTHDTTTKHNNLLNLIKSSFPKKKFSGGDQNYTVIEYLEGMNQGQKLCNLSESEFKDMLLQTTTGTVYDTMRSYLSLKMPVKDIYNWLLAVYHKPLSADSALDKLLNFNIPKYKKLADATSEVLQLAIRASHLTPEKNRIDIVDNYAAQFLLKSLPHESQQLARKIYQDMAIHKDGESPSFVHFSKALSRYAPSINKDISINGANSSNHNNNMRRNNNRQLSIRNINARSNSNNNNNQVQTYKQNSFSRNMINNNKTYNNQRAQNNYKPKYNSQQSYTNMGQQNKNFNNKPIYRNSYYKQNSYQRPPQSNSFSPRVNEIKIFNRNKNDNNYKKMNDSTNNFKKMNDSTYKRMQNNPNKVPMKQYCTLCGGNSHNASDVCYKMRNENNEIVPVPPSFAPCPFCLKQDKKLYHPEEFCFNKKNKLYNRNNFTNKTFNKNRYNKS